MVSRRTPFLLIEEIDNNCDFLFVCNLQNFLEISDGTFFKRFAQKDGQISGQRSVLFKQGDKHRSVKC